MLFTYLSLSLFPALFISLMCVFFFLIIPPFFSSLSVCHTPRNCLPDNVEFELSGYLVVDVWDHDTVNQDDFMGQIMIPLREIPLATPKKEWFQLMKRSVKDKVDGAILLEVLLVLDRKQVCMCVCVCVQCDAVCMYV